MKYIYKNGTRYIYKRRLPYSKRFYTFNIKTKNQKKALKVATIFNKLSFDIFNFIKSNEENMELDFEEVAILLNDYRDKALLEYKELEASRHQHLEKLFKVEKNDPLLGARLLSGGEPEVIEKALQTFKTLSLSDFSKKQNQTLIKKYGMEILKRCPMELKHFFAQFKRDDENIYMFLSLLFKTEADILKIDYARANQRFNPNFNMVATQNQQFQSQSQSFSQDLQKENKPLKELRDDFLFSKCGYDKDDLKDSKCQASKVAKMVDFFLEFMQHKTNSMVIKSITTDLLKECMSLVIYLPKKSGNLTQTYNYYEEYLKKEEDEEYEKRGISTLKNDLSNLRRFCEYLEEKSFISPSDLKELINHYKNQKTKVGQLVVAGKINSSKNRVAFKSQMLKCLFSNQNPYYDLLFNTFLGKQKLRAGQEIEMYEARFYIPLLLFFCGARVEEMSHLKVSDFEIRTYDDGVKRVLIYLVANEIRDLKTYTSRRIILLNDYFVHELHFLDYLQKAIKEEREYLFKVKDDVSIKVSKEFNRENVKESCINPHLTREDIFELRSYSLHSLRHNYKTHMLINKFDGSIIKKLQGHKYEEKSSDVYFTYDSEEILQVVNGFTLHEKLDFDIFKEVARVICN